VVLVERLVGDRELAAQHRAQRLDGGASLQPREPAARGLVPLEPGEHRRQSRDCLRIAVLAEFLEGVGERAAVAAAVVVVAPLRPAIAADLQRASTAAERADRLAVIPCGRA
jgi:hypothetical protein